ncbi:unnamed protein product [Phaedon cochleariae]|uniref:Uncharacterized protein n=1 Tax=Phaedon cochleariae TaxID=80249 RepID=A0A9P0DKE3_PHACE|nr:unnamed protein product [Phaedon cochleariae]
MRVIILVGVLCAIRADSQYWNHPQKIFQGWFRQPRMSMTTKVPSLSTKPIADTTTVLTTKIDSTTVTPAKLPSTLSTLTDTTPSSTSRRFTGAGTTSSIGTTGTTEASTFETTNYDVTGTTEEPRDNSRTHDFYLSKREKPQIKISTNISQNLLPLPAGASAVLVKPTKYHYYPHNQHIYLLPECAIQQVCNAVYVRLNWTQPLCACPSRYRDPCSASLNSDDLHTTELATSKNAKKALTLVKTCEPTAEMRLCRSPRDWSLLALQNIRSGKSHYLIICRCPDSSILEGPMSHDQPTYASVPGIRVFGMMCVDSRRGKRQSRISKSLEMPPFPLEKAYQLAKTAIWD